MNTPIIAAAAIPATSCQSSGLPAYVFTGLLSLLVLLALGAAAVAAYALFDMCRGTIVARRGARKPPKARCTWDDPTGTGHG